MALVDQPPGTPGTPRLSGIPGPTAHAHAPPRSPPPAGSGGTVVPIPASVLRQANRRAMHLLPSLQRQFGGVPLPLRSNHYDAVATLVAKLDTENSPVKSAASLFLNDLVDADDAQVTAEREAAAAAQRARVTSPTRVMSPVERVLSPTSPRSPRRSLDRSSTPSGLPVPRLTTPTFGVSASPVTGRFPRPSPLGSPHARNGSTHSALPQLKPVPLTKRRPSSDPPQPLQEMQPNAPLTPQRGGPPRRKVGAHHAAYARLIEQQEQAAQKPQTPTRIQRPASVAYPASFGTPSHIPRPGSQLDCHSSIPTRPVSAFVSSAPPRELKEPVTPKEPLRPAFEPTSSTSSASSGSSSYSGHSRTRSGLAAIGEGAPPPARWAHLPDPATHLLLPERPTAAARARMIELGAILSHFEVVRARMESYRDELDGVRAQLRPALDALGDSSGSGSSSYATPTATPGIGTGYATAAAYSRRTSMECDTPTRPSTSASVTVGASAGRERTWI